MKCSFCGMTYHVLENCRKMEEAKSKLQNTKPPTSGGGGQRGRGGGRSSSGQRGGGCGGCGGRPGYPKNSEETCHTCGKTGHYAWACTDGAKDHQPAGRVNATFIVPGRADGCHEEQISCTNRSIATQHTLGEFKIPLSSLPTGFKVTSNCLSLIMGVPHILFAAKMF